MAYTRGLFTNFMVIFGSIFVAIGGLITAGFCVGTLLVPPLFFAVCLGLFFVAFGSVFLFVGVQNALNARRVLMYGAVTTGRVSDVQLTAGFWTLTYLYDVGQGTLGDSLQTTDAMVSQYKEGDALHVVYDPGDPANSSVWPPLPLAV